MDKIKAIASQLSDSEISQLMQELRNSGAADKRFDINLVEGQRVEKELVEILETVEVKRDFRTKETGNVVVEYECRGEPSGIAATEAKWWAFFVADDTAVLVTTEKLKKLARPYLNSSRDVVGGDDNLSKIILLPISKLLPEKEGEANEYWKPALDKALAQHTRRPEDGLAEMRALAFSSRAVPRSGGKR